MTVEIPVVAECLVGERLRVRFQVVDADRAPVVPVTVVARVGPRDGVASEAAVTIADGLASFDLEPTTVGPWAFQIDVASPVKAVEHGLVRVLPSAFGAPDA